MWPNTAFLDRLGITLPIIQAPMAGVSDVDMAEAVTLVGGLGSLPAAMKSTSQLEQDMHALAGSSNGSVNVNFFCHEPIAATEADNARWAQTLEPFYEELGADAPVGGRPSRQPFGDEQCAVVEKIRPQVVSFHFGLPAEALLARVKAVGTIVMATATTVAEARWLEAHGCDVIIAQGCEAGGHRGMFLHDDISTQVGTVALVPQIVDAVSLPVVAAGGIADGRGIAAAFALGASAVQLGTVYIQCNQSLASDLYLQALANSADNSTALTNVFSGKPARGILNRVMRELGPMSDEVPVFPHAGAAMQPLRVSSEQRGLDDFSSHWSGQSANLGPRHEDAGELTKLLIGDAQRVIEALGR